MSSRCTISSVGKDDEGGARARTRQSSHSEEIDSEEFMRIAFKCRECFFGHQNGGRIYLNGVSRL